LAPGRAAGGTREKVSFEKKRFFPGEKLGKTCYINALNEQTINKEE